MSAPTSVTWAAEPHTMAKHRILKHYLGAWYTILTRSGATRLAYVDGFAGPGRYDGGQPGSPVIAIEEARKVSDRFPDRTFTFFLIDEDPRRISHLDNEIQPTIQPSNFQFKIEPGEFSSKMSDALNAFDRKGVGLPPTFVFVDPFGFSGFPLHLVGRILDHRMSEVFITFMARDVNRFLSDPGKRNSFVELCGTDEVFQIIDTPSDRTDNVVQFYVEKLRKLKPGLFVRLFCMTDKHDQPIYYLIFVTQSNKGFVEMKTAMWKVDHEGGVKFSDGQDPNQYRLLSQNHEENLLQRMEQKYQGQTVTCGTIRTFVENRTGYIASHMKASLKLGESSQRITVSPNKESGKRRRRDTFPDDVIVTFPQS